MRYKICKIAEPGDMYTYDQRYFTPEEMQELQDNLAFLIAFLERKKKQLDKMPGLKKLQGKLQELL